MTTNRNRDKLARDQLAAIQRADFQTAYSIAEQAIVEPTILDTLTFNSAGLLIDCGLASGNEYHIQLGLTVSLAFKAAHGLDKVTVVRATYNTANAYGALAKLEQLNGGELTNVRKLWELERDELQELVLNPKHIPDNIATEVYTNFGNVLSHLGRQVEAISIFKRVLRRNPNHPIANGSMGQLLLSQIGIQADHDWKLVACASQHLRRALSDRTNIAWHSAGQAEASYEDTLRKCSEYAVAIAGSVSAFEEAVDAVRLKHRGFTCKDPMNSWAEDGLLLTVNPRATDCPATVVDDLDFAPILTATDESGMERFRVLAHTFNQLKEDFALARFLLYYYRNSELYREISSITRYVDTQDYSDFGLRSGMLKATIKLAVDSLDKIGYFLNRYLSLGIPENRVYFSTVWYAGGSSDPKKRTLHPIMEIELQKSAPLMGILDVADNLDFYPAASKSLRNRSTHDYLLIENVTKPKVILRGKQIEVDALEYATQLLLMSKGAIVNLVAFVRTHEDELSQNLTGPIGSLFYRYGEGISDEFPN